MQLHNISSKNRKYPAPRVGHGGKRGTYSGRGQKGQRSRSGHKIRPAERDLIQRLPKLRGFRNKPLALPMCLVNLDELQKIMKGRGEVATPEIVLRAKGFAAKSGVKIKILAMGTLRTPLTVRGFEISVSAAKKIVAMGGKVI